MNDIFQCGDSAALVAYLYDECEPGEQEQIAAHVKRCVTCAGEIDALRATRQTLAAWTPPDLALGFRIERDADVARAKVLQPKIAWWRAPLPAWAQAAAALVIFAAGLATGIARNESQAPATQTAAAVPAETRPVAAPSVARDALASRDELAQLEQRVRAEFNQLRSTATPTAVAARGSDDALLQQVRTLIEQSEENQRKDFTLRMVELAGNIEQQRRVDLTTVRQSMGQLQDVTGTELRQQREVLGRLVSERSR
jgi:anti-sigma factor ChrR (cupin superfamily)